MAATKVNNAQLNGAIVSTGSAEANKIIITNSTGKIDNSMLPASISTDNLNNAIALAIALGGI